MPPGGLASPGLLGEVLATDTWFAPTAMWVISSASKVGGRIEETQLLASGSKRPIPLGSPTEPCSLGHFVPVPAHNRGPSMISDVTELEGAPLSSRYTTQAP